MENHKNKTTKFRFNMANVLQNTYIAPPRWSDKGFVLCGRHLKPRLPGMCHVKIHVSQQKIPKLAFDLLAVQPQVISKPCKIIYDWVIFCNCSAVWTWGCAQGIAYSMIKKQCAWIFLVLTFTRSFGFLQPTMQLVRAGSNFNWHSEDLCEWTHSKWVLAYVPRS